MLFLGAVCGKFARTVLQGAHGNERILNEIFKRIQEL